MKKLLYVTASEMPYRVRFFNELAKHCDLTVLFESAPGAHRNKQWSLSEKKRFKSEYLKYNKLGKKLKFSFGIMKYLRSEYDVIIMGCINTKTQAIAILLMKLFRIRYCVNLDGETLWNDRGIRGIKKELILKGAQQYLVAGEKCGQTIAHIAKKRKISPYYFSGLYESEIRDRIKKQRYRNKDGHVLVVAQYLPQKGNDVVLDVARRDPNHHYKFVGMGPRTNQFLADFGEKIPENVEVIPFLQKEELEKEYQQCGMMVLPSRRECWGLVINEAASFGVPIVSTWGSGAAIEFLSDDYPQFLAKPGDAEDLMAKIELLRESFTEDYCTFLQRKALQYTIENMVNIHLEACCTDEKRNEG